MYELADVIRTARQRSGLSQRALAERTGVWQPQIAAYESGARQPSLATVDKLLVACKLQLRFELEPRVNQLDAVVRRLLAMPPRARLESEGAWAYRFVELLIESGARLVVGGHLAARLHGAPLDDLAEIVHCDPADEPALRVAARLVHRDVRPHRPGVFVVGPIRVTVGAHPPATKVLTGRATVPVVGLDVLLDAYPWPPPDRTVLGALLAIRDLGQHSEVLSEPNTGGRDG